MSRTVQLIEIFDVEFKCINCHRIRKFSTNHFRPYQRCSNCGFLMVCHTLIRHRVL